MSHRESCPDRWEAHREGERAQERVYGSFRNPYDGYGEDACDEAAREWRSGWYAAERREEERREEEAAHERAARARAEEAAYELACWEEAQIAEQYPDEPFEEPLSVNAGATPSDQGAPESAQNSSSFVATKGPDA